MLDFWTRLFDPTGFIPRAQCGAWTPALIRLHNFSDFLIWTAYLAIPIVLVRFAWKRRSDLPFRSLFALFGIFILACGTTHLIDIVLFYYPLYRLSGLVKLVTAAASWGTVASLFYVVPRAIDMKSPLVLQQEMQERKNIEEHLRRSEERFRSSFESATIGKALVSLEGKWLDVNPALCQLAGYTKEEFLALTFQDITHPDDLDKDMDNVSQLLQGTINSYQMEKRYFHKSGRELWILLSVVIVHDDEGQPLYFVSEIQDISEHKQIEAMRREARESLERTVQEQAEDNTKLYTLAVTDGLTGLSNRRAFEENLSREFGRAKRAQTPLSLLLLDVGHFKAYNDAFGHPAGDDALRQVAQLLITAARVTDTVSRFGGEEFAVILPDTNRDGAEVFAERFRQTIESAFWTHQVVTASIGVCTLHESLAAKSCQFLIDEADKALYESKKRGRNCVTHAPAANGARLSATKS